jgi:ParB family transcriptional regulator, chromosome partitioning protein
LLFIDDKDQQSELAQMVKQRRLTSKSVREIVKEVQNGDKLHFDINGISNDKGYFDKVERSRKSIDKSIAILRIAMNRISALIESNENNWIVYEILMQHKNMLHTQIGILLKEKTKMSRRICT